MEYVASVRRLSFFTVDKALQKEGIGSLNGVILHAREARDHAAEARNEGLANGYLSVLMLATAMKKGLEMWLALKRGRERDAWEFMVDAQRTARRAMLAGFGPEPFDELAAQAESWERALFPPQHFASAGLIVWSMTCSICGGDALVCPHQKGRPYMGRLCRYRYDALDLDHVSAVKHPENKKCRVTSFTSDSRRYDTLTRRLIAYRDGEDRLVKIKAFHTTDLEF